MEREVCNQLRRAAGDSNGRHRGTDDVDRFFVSDWDNHPPLEQARLIRLILESVEYDGLTERVTLTLTDEAAANLAPQQTESLSYKSSSPSPV